MPEATDKPDLDELQAALEHATAEAKRWKTVAKVLAEHIRDLTAVQHAQRQLDAITDAFHDRVRGRR